MATLKIDMCSACSFVIPTMQPAMTAADLFAQWMSSASHNTQASAPFLSTFSQTPPQHYRAGHTLPQSMQPQCTTAAFTQPFAPTPQQQQPQLLGHTVPQPTQAPFANSAFTQPPSCHTFNTPHHSTAMPGLQPPPHYNAAIPNLQLSPPQYGSFVTYQSTPQSTSTTLVQPVPATPFSQQFPTTTASTPPLSHNKHSRTRSRTTRKKHRSTTRRRRRHRSTNRHCFFGILADWFFGQAGDLILYLIYSLQTTSLIRSVSTPKKFGLFVIWFSTYGTQDQQR